MSHALRFTAEKIEKRIALIQPLVHRAQTPLAPFTFEILADAVAEPGSGTDCGVVDWNSYWAGQDTHFVLRSTVEIPADYSNPALYLPLGVSGDIFTHPEALLHIDGRAVASADRHHQLVPLDVALADGAPHDVLLHGWTGLTGWPINPNDPARLLIKPCFVVDIDTQLQDLVTLASVALDVARAPDLPDRLCDKMLGALDHSFMLLDTRAPMGAGFRASVTPALTQLRTALAAMEATLPEQLHAIGHAHMDIAYLWPIAQIRRKNARTYSNVLRLMDRHEGFHFSHSQPQLYAYTQADYPEIFDAIRKRVAEGRWEVMGGMWVEPDCNLPGGEALVRQILLGRRYFRENFGDVETPVLWLPDTFGFPWSLPQLMKLSGLELFVTNKLNWNQYNKMPSSTTWWQGIDGSKVLAHFLTTPRAVQHLPFPTNYKSDLSAAEVIGTVTNATTGNGISDLPICYGYGDGGGGPTDELIRKVKDFAFMPGAPRVKMGPIRDVMHAMQAQSAKLPVWNDELYMEGHRGTLTSQGWIKRANRKAERDLHDAEAALVMAYPHGAPEGIRAQLRDLWERLCLHQFHDILTGTSVPIVFAEARAAFAQIKSETADLLAKALAARLQGKGLALFNGASVSGPSVVLIPKGREAKDGQAVEGGHLAFVASPAAYSLAPFETIPATDTAMICRDGDLTIMENGILRVMVDGAGQVASVLHIPTGRETLAPGQAGNQLMVHEDRPISWDAWDIDVFQDDRMEVLCTPAKVELVENGPLRCALRVTRSYRDSTIVQRIELTAASPRLDFVTEVDWHERHHLLKVAFPVNILSPRARYEIQWGEIERPTHRNTLWDYAKFEVPAQRWADLSEAGFGVALLNDCKHGYGIEENRMHLTLIKSSTNPDPGADQGHHRFTYALLPHAGDAQLVHAEARRLNNPTRVFVGTPTATTFVQCDNPRVLVETLKPADDGNGFILRLYEAHRSRGKASLCFAQPMARVSLCSLLEKDMAQVQMTNNGITLDVTPFQIISLRCIPA